MNRIHKYADSAQEYSYEFNLLYNEYSKFLFDINLYTNSNYSSVNNYKEIFQIEELNSDWINSKTNYSLSNHLNFQHIKCSQLDINEFKKSGFFFFNFTLNDYTTKILKTDETIFYYQENIIIKINSEFDKAIESLFENFQLKQVSKNYIVCSIYISGFIIMQIYIYLGIIIFKRNFLIVYIKSYTLFNVLKVYSNENFKKSYLLIEIISDFSEERLNILKEKFRINKKSHSESQLNQTLNNSIYSQLNTIVDEKKESMNKYFMNILIHPEIKLNENGEIFEVNDFRLFYNLYKETFSYDLQLFENIILKYGILNKKDLSLRKISPKKFLPAIKNYMQLSIEKKFNIEDCNKINQTIYKNEMIEFNINENSTNLNNQERNLKNFFKNIAKKLFKKQRIVKDLIESNINSNNQDKNNNQNNDLDKADNSQNRNNFNNPINNTESSLNKSSSILLKSKNLSKSIKVPEEMNIKEKEKINRIVKKISKIDQENLIDLFTNVEDSQKDFTKCNDFKKPLIYHSIIKIFYIFMILLVVICILIIKFILDNFVILDINYQCLNLYSKKYIFVFEIILIFKYSLIYFNETSIEVNDINNSINEIILFENKFREYERIVSDLNIILHKYPNFSDIIDIDNQLNSKFFCVKYANFTFYEKFNNNPNSDNYTFFEDLKNECLIGTEGLNQFGLHQSLDTMIKIVQNYYRDLKHLIIKNQDLSNTFKNFKENLMNQKKYYISESQIELITEKMLKITKTFMNDISYEKINYNLNTIIFETWLYQINQVNELLKVKEEEVFNHHDAIHSLLYFIDLLVVFFNLFSYYFIIEKGKNLQDYSRNLIYNSIKYNIFDI